MLAGCRRRWAKQGLTPPSMDDLVVISGLTAVALRYTTPGDLTQLLSEQIGSARDVIGLVRWRLQRCINKQRRRHEMPVDDDGDLYTVKAQARADEAARLHQENTDRRAAVRAAMDAARARKAAREATEPRRRSLAGSLVAEQPSRTESETALAEELAARGIAAAGGPTPAELAALRQAMANARAAQRRRQPPPVAKVLRGRDGETV